MEHLHEVRAADQSARVPKEDQQEGLPAQVVQAEASRIERWQVERPRVLADCRCVAVGHAAQGPRRRRRAPNIGSLVMPIR
jgi:hypothetical protein